MSAAPALDATPLAARAVALRGDGVASRCAAALLESLGARVHRREGRRDEHPALGWARHGLMALTGSRSGPPRMIPAPLAACADGVVKALAALGAELPQAERQGAPRLAERAALLGLRRNGTVSAGGSCRLLASGDGMLAVNLARREDWDALAAWLDGRAARDWDELAHALRGGATEPLLERARLLGLPVAAAQLPGEGRGWCRVQRCGERVERDPKRRPLVVDLSSLWAGPLCAQLLRQLGARVVKVESLARPDGARAGAAAFYDRMNAGKASVALDFARAGDRARLRALLLRADIVVESARARALPQLGIDAEQLLAERPGLTWVSISGHGRDEPGANWTAFGDDAGVGGGLSALLEAVSGEWAFCADAVADPLTGLHAALAAWSDFLAGGGSLIALALHEVVAHCARWELPAEREALVARWQRWSAIGQRAGAAAPTAPPSPGQARALGADNVEVLGELGC